MTRMSSQARGPTVLAAAATALLAGCGTDTGFWDRGPEVITETIGDTTVVRTVSGGVWGAEATLVPEVSIGELDGAEEYLFGGIWSIAVDDDRVVYVLDAQARQVRVFDSAGEYVRTLGGRGEGPGEFRSAEAIALLPDGRLVVRDSGRNRVHVFGPGAGDIDHWPYDAGNSGSDAPLHTDADGRTYVLTRDLSRPLTDFARHIIVLGPDGTHLDTVPEPSSNHDQAVVTASGGSGTYTSRVPFSPAFAWTVHPSGHFLTGVSSTYRIDLAGDDGVLRIERATNPVPVSDAEREYERNDVMRYMRGGYPDWSWNGPPIPDHKPYFKALLTGRDGRIWVRLSTAGQPVENEDHDPDDPWSDPVTWPEPMRYDVFEPDGTYLGVVRAPDEFMRFRLPVFDGDHVWAVTRDELDVERVVRYRIVVGGDGE